MFPNGVTSISTYTKGNFKEILSFFIAGGAAEKLEIGGKRSAFDYKLPTVKSRSQMKIPKIHTSTLGAEGMDQSDKSQTLVSNRQPRIDVSICSIYGDINCKNDLLCGLRKVGTFFSLPDGKSSELVLWCFVVKCPSIINPFNTSPSEAFTAVTLSSEETPV